MEKFTCIVLVSCVLMLAGCATKLPSGLVKAYGEKGWSKVATQDTITVWRNSFAPGSYIMTKGEGIVAVVPTDADNDWVDVYVDNNPALTISRSHNTILGKADHKWKFQGKGSIEK